MPRIVPVTTDKIRPPERGQTVDVHASDAGALALARLRDATDRLAELTRGRTRTGRSHDDADDETGSVGTDDAVGFDPLPLLRELDRHGARVCVIGQVAGILHGSAELTGDLDLLWDGAPEQVPALVAGFAAAGARLTDDAGATLPTDAAAFALPKVLFATRTASGDCCTPALPWGELPVAAYLERCDVLTTPDGVTLRYLALEDLVAMRLAAGRPKDLRRAAELRRSRSR
jgi:hypothetical protein